MNDTTTKPANHARGALRALTEKLRTLLQFFGIVLLVLLQPLIPVGTLLWVHWIHWSGWTKVAVTVYYVIAVLFGALMALARVLPKRDRFV